MDRFEINGLTVASALEPKVRLVKAGVSLPDEYEFTIDVQIKVVGNATDCASATQAIRNLRNRKFRIVNEEEEQS